MVPKRAHPDCFRKDIAWENSHPSPHRYQNTWPFPYRLPRWGDPGRGTTGPEYPAPTSRSHSFTRRSGQLIPLAAAGSVAVRSSPRHCGQSCGAEFVLRAVGAGPSTILLMLPTPYWSLTLLMGKTSRWQRSLILISKKAFVSLRLALYSI